MRVEPAAPASPVAAQGRRPRPEPARPAAHGSVVSRPRHPWWLWPHLLSLDAPLVALAWQGWWSRATGTATPVSQRAILGLGVWMIYLADRLADTTRGLPGDSATARHEFAWTWQRPLLVLTALIGTALVLLSPRLLLPGQFCGGLCLLAVAGAYFWLIHRREAQGWMARLPKEAVVGGLFALGTAFFALCRAAVPSGWLLVAIASFGVICFLNCALITSWERNLCDRRDPFSFLNAFPGLAGRGLRPLCWGMASVVIGLGMMTQTPLFLPVALAALSLGTLDCWRQRLSPDALRCLVDTVLLTPWICGVGLAAAR